MKHQLKQPSWTFQGIEHAWDYPVALGHPYKQLPAQGAPSFSPEDSPVGLKYDQGKPRLELIDSEWLEGVGRVLGFGAEKYAANNWRKGLAITRLLGASLRHIFAFLRGEDNDPESGECHLYHASFGLMTASWMLKHRPELDDRYKGAA